GSLSSADKRTAGNAPGRSHHYPIEPPGGKFSSQADNPLSHLGNSQPYRHHDPLGTPAKATESGSVSRGF
ncbi:MAG: hypothetical protein QGH11_13025, partial [Pirellulaceae bacterium]|nr:hypothetical protein [Pirellulaceae bacterium]